MAVTLVRYLANLGYGSRREVAAMLARGGVRSREGRVLAASDAIDHDDVRIDGAPLDAPPGTVIVLNKPTGYVCALAHENSVIYDLLPPRVRHRSPVMAPVGRLDRDTSGLLLVTDDGALNHRITSPRSKLPKVYQATLATALHGGEADIFASGTLMLDGESAPLFPASLEQIDDRRVRVTIREGRYHQVRRMFAAVGNHVTRLERIAIGGLQLGELPAGAWRTASADELAGLNADLVTARAESRSTP